MATPHGGAAGAVGRTSGTGAALRALLLVASVVAAISICITLDNPSGILLFLAYGATGGYLVFRRPANSVGWLLMVSGWGAALGSVPADAAWASVLERGVDTETAIVVWANACAWSVFFVGLTGLALVFPDGGLPSGRARWPCRVLLGASVLLAALIAFNPTINDIFGHAIANPVVMFPGSAVWTLVPDPNTMFTLLLGALVLGIASLLVRAHRSTGLPRLQYRWLVAAIGLVAFTTAIWASATFVLGQDPVGPTYLLALFTYPSVPLAITVAVLRYRLFEIDRIISRTLAYAIVTATLAVVFVGIVLGLQALLERFVGGNTIAVAASTLVVAALFQPLRRRVQRIVDRRFNRARYDAQRTVDAFNARLRDETDLDRLSRDLTAVVEGALAPQSAGVWIRVPEDAR